MKILRVTKSNEALSAIRLFAFGIVNRETVKIITPNKSVFDIVNMFVGDYWSKVNMNFRFIANETEKSITLQA